MPKEKSSYNFRYARERERFYKDVVSDQAEHVSKIKNASERQVESSALRVVFDIGTGKSAEELGEPIDSKGDVQGKGELRGFRSFHNLNVLRSFLTASTYSGIFARNQIGRYNVNARISKYRTRGKRVLGEKVVKTYKIVFD